VNTPTLAVSTPSSKRNWQNILPWVVFLTGMLYYCFAYLLRVYPSVMEGHLLSRFDAPVRDFGFITGFYYLAYAPMQLFVGVTVDRIGARQSLLRGCLIACLGVFIFASTRSFEIALAGRFLIGLGAAFAYVTALKIATLWLPRRFFATATGFVTGGGMIAAIFTDNYLTHLIHNSGFHRALYFPLYAGVFVFLCIFLMARNKKNTPEEIKHSNIAYTGSYRQLLLQLWGIAKMPQMWLIGIVGALLYLPSSVFVDAWAIPFLKTARHFTSAEAAVGASVTLAGWIISSFVTGYLSDRLHTRKIPLLIAAVGAAFISSAIIFIPISQPSTMYILLFLLGVCCGPHPLCFALSKENCPVEISGTAVSFANFLIMLGGMLLQPAVGEFLSMLKHGAKIMPTAYTNVDFAIALSIIPIGLIVAFFLVLRIKETYGRHN